MTVTGDETAELDKGAAKTVDEADTWESTDMDTGIPGVDTDETGTKMGVLGGPQGCGQFGPRDLAACSAGTDPKKDNHEAGDRIPDK